MSLVRTLLALAALMMTSMIASLAHADDGADYKLSASPRQGSLIIGKAPTGAVSLSLNGQPVKLGLDGAFVIGFGREALPRATLVATLPDGKQVTRQLIVAARAWRFQAVNGVPPATVTIPPEMQARRESEIAQMRAARAGFSDRRDWQSSFIWPAEGRISGVYGSQRIYNGIDKGSAHLGVDVAAPKGAPVKAPAGGVVVLAAPDFLLEGGLLMVDHGFGVYSAFMHLSRLDVKPGDEVTQGQVIAAVGGTGRATGPHLHWNLYWGAEKLDAQLIMPPRPGIKPAGLKPMMQPVPMGKDSAKSVLPPLNPAQ